MRMPRMSEASGVSGRPYELVKAGHDEWSFLLPDGKLGCSGRDPVREAARRCEAVGADDEPVLLGLGIGHAFELLVNRCRGRVTVVEADPRMIDTFAERAGRVGRVHPLSRIEWITGDEQFVLSRLIASIAEDHEERPLIIDPSCVERWQHAAPRLAGWTRDLLLRRSMAHGLEPLIAANSAANRELLATATGLTDLSGCWGADDVLVCGAGPSLATALEEMRGRAVRIVAASTALPALARKQVSVDLAVATDPSPLLAADLEQTEVLAGTWLLCFPGTSSELVTRWPGPRVLALPGGNGIVEDSWNGRRPGVLESGFGTVAGPALLAAAFLSRGSLTLGGIDLEVQGPRYATGVRRPSSLPVPDFRLARRRMRELCSRLGAQGREVQFAGARPDWSTEEARP